MYDAWDKQACLVAVSDLAMRALVREQYRPYHDREILQSDTELVSAILTEIDVPVYSRSSFLSSRLVSSYSYGDHTFRLKLKRYALHHLQGLAQDSSNSFDASLSI